MNKQHSINYVELTSNDLVATKEFYSIAFGWTFTDWGETYSAIDNAGLDGGFELGEPKPGTILVILYSEDLIRSLHAVQSAGGKIVTEPFNFPGGRRFHFSDPSGNELAVWSDK